MEIVACAYRTWGLKVAQMMAGSFSDHRVVLCTSPAEFEAYITAHGNPELILAIGWSWIFPAEITDRTWIVGVHPSDLPAFAGGSPIQNQILAGVTHTRSTLFRITADVDRGPILDKIGLSLEGHLDEIFERLSYTSFRMISNFVERFARGEFVEYAGHHPEPSYFRRLKPESGRLSPETMHSMGTRQLYDFIRCREAPYPNAYLEDTEGILTFCRVEWSSK